MLNRWVIPILLWSVGAGTAFSQPFTVLPSAAAQQTALQPQSVDEFDEYGEALLRGPIHEAYAEQYNQEPVEGVVIDRVPPPPVPEIPPEQKLNEPDVEWLSGYWFWDDERNDFVWISGVWRKMPPGQRWLPGYWAEVNGQHQWVAGTWLTSDRAEVEYIAQSPPESLELGPVGQPPSTEHFWIPGCWNWQQTNYAWRPGYWSMGYSDWVWVPERYLWTPGGYVYSAGYWDYPFAGRGTLFAPFWFNQPVYARSGFFFTPRVSLLAAALQTHLWVRPGFRHYYFGDFYGANYAQFGIYPWHTFHRGFGRQRGPWGFDPLFAHYNRNFQTRGINYFQQVNNQYNVFVNQSDRRPAHTYRDQLVRERSWQGTDRPGGRGSDWSGGRGSRDDAWSDGRLGESFRDAAQRDRSRYTNLSSEDRNRMRSGSGAEASLANLRRETETRGWSDRTRSSAMGADASGRRDFARDSSRGLARDSATASAERLRLPPAARGESSSAQGGSGREARGLADGAGRRPAASTQSSRGIDTSSSRGRSSGSPAQSGRETPTDGRYSAARETLQNRFGRPATESGAAGGGRQDRGSAVSPRSPLTTPTPERSGSPGSRPDRGGSPISRPGLGDSPGSVPSATGSTPGGRPSVLPDNAPRVERGTGRPSVTPGRPGGSTRSAPGVGGSPSIRPQATTPSPSPGLSQDRPTIGSPRSLPGSRPSLSPGGSRATPQASSPSVSRPSMSLPQRSSAPSISRPSISSPQRSSPSISRPSISSPQRSSPSISRPSISSPQRSSPSISRPSISAPQRSAAPQISSGSIGRSGGSSSMGIGRSGGSSRSMPSISSGGGRGGSSFGPSSRGGGSAMGGGGRGGGRSGRGR